VEAGRPVQPFGVDEGRGAGGRRRWCPVRTPRPAGATVAVLLVLGGLLAACSSPTDEAGSDESIASDTTPPPTTTGASTESPVTVGSAAAAGTSPESGDGGTEARDPGSSDPSSSSRAAAGAQLGPTAPGPASGGPGPTPGGGPGSTTRSFSDGFDRPDGAVGNGWANATSRGPAIRGGMLATGGSPALLAVYREAPDLDPNGDWQIEFDVVSPVAVGHGGAVVYVGSPGRSGYSVFVGNAVHVQRRNPDGSHLNLTNDDRSGGRSGVRADHVTWIHRANGDHEVYLNGELWSSVNDTVSNPGLQLALIVQNTDAPDEDCTIDNLVVRS